MNASLFFPHLHSLFIVFFVGGLTLRNFGGAKLRITELNNVVKRAVLLTRGNLITATELSLAIGPIQQSSSITSLHDEDDERSRIIAALKQTNGNKAKAARLLGIDRKTIYNKIEKLGITLT